MKEWLVECSRPITREDVDAGIFGARICKSFIVCGDTGDEARENVRLPEGFTIDSVKDWGRIQDECLAASLKWLWSK